MNRKLLFILLPVLVVVIGGGAAFALMKPTAKTPKPHLVGNVVPFPGSFTINLAGGHYATLTLALLLPATALGGPADPPVIRAIVTNDLTGQPEGALIAPHGRAALAKRILTDINTQTNATVSRVYFTDLAVQ